MKLLKYLKIYVQIFRNSLSSHLAYRTNFFLWIMINSIMIFLTIFFFSVIYSNIPIVNGWDYYKTLTVLGTSYLLIGIGAITYFPFMYSFSDDVKSGKLDFLLFKPKDIQFLASFQFADTEDIINIPIALIVLGIAMSKLEVTNPLLSIFSFIVLLLSSNVIIYSIILLIQTLALKAVNVEAAQWIIWNIVELGKYPVKVFTGPLRTLFMLIIPIGLITTVPAEVLMGIFDLKFIIISLITSIFLFITSRIIFKFGLRSYSSASS